MAKDDPYHDNKMYHYAQSFRSDGAVSALCFKRRRAINLRIALWTTTESAVTCPKCRAALVATEARHERVAANVRAKHSRPTSERVQ